MAPFHLAENWQGERMVIHEEYWQQEKPVACRFEGNWQWEKTAACHPELNHHQETIAVCHLAENCLWGKTTSSHDDHTP